MAESLGTQEVVEATLKHHPPQYHILAAMSLGHVYAGELNHASSRAALRSGCHGSRYQLWLAAAGNWKAFVTVK